MLLCVTHHCDLGYNLEIFNESSRADLSDASLARRRIFPSHVYPRLFYPSHRLANPLTVYEQIHKSNSIHTHPPHPLPPPHFPLQTPQLNYRYSLQATTLTSASTPLAVSVPVPFPPPPPNNTLLPPSTEIPIPITAPTPSSNSPALKARMPGPSGAVSRCRTPLSPAASWPYVPRFGNGAVAPRRTPPAE